MKKTAIIALLLVFVVGFGFASNSSFTLYSEEEYSIYNNFLGSVKQKSYGDMVGIGADIVFGMKNTALDIAGTLHADVDASRIQISKLGLLTDAIKVQPGFDIKLNLGTFKGSWDGCIYTSRGDEYDIVDGGHDKTMGLGVAVNTDADWVIPMLKRNAFFDVYTNGGFEFTKLEGDGETIKWVAGDINMGVGYYLPRKEAVKDNPREYFFDLSSKDEFDIANDYVFFVKFDASTDLDKTSYAGSSSDFTLNLEGNYNLAFGGRRDNVMTFKTSVAENFGKNYSSKYNNVKLDNKMMYFLKLNKGVNAIDYFKLVTTLDTAMILGMKNGSAKPAAFEIMVDADVYLPRIIPVELLDNFSLALPADVYISYDTMFDSMKNSETEFGYRVTLTPFYMEIKKGIKFLDMYLNTVRLDAEFKDFYAFGSGVKAHSDARVFGATLSVGMDKVNNVTEENNGSLNIDFRRNFNEKENFVTIALDVKF